MEAFSSKKNIFSFLYSEPLSKPTPHRDYDLWNSVVFTNFELKPKDVPVGTPLFQKEKQAKQAWQSFVAKQGKGDHRLPVFSNITRKNVHANDFRDSSLSRGLNGWDAYCQQEQTPSQEESLITVDLASCLDDNRLDWSSTSTFPSKKQNLQRVVTQETIPLKFQPLTLEQHQWSHLRYAAEELCPEVGFMEEAFTRLVDKKASLNPRERLSTLQHLSKVLTPHNVLKLCLKTHSRRQVMFALDFLWQEKQTRFQVYAVVSKMFEGLHTLIEADAKDMVLAKKFHVFHNVVASCNMQQVVGLAKCLLKASKTGVASTLGLAIIGRLIERANSMDFRSSAHWLDDCLPGLAINVLRVSNIKCAYQIMGAASVKHLLNNLRLDHPMFRGGSE